MAENKVKMTKQETEEWNELYNYVHDEVLKYSSDMKLPKFIVLRLKGLKDGKFCANKKQDSAASYSFKTILYTFKICKIDIINYVTRNSDIFKDERHKFNGIMVIIENNINDVVMRLKNIKKSEEKVENLKMDNQMHEGFEYIKKGESKINKNLEDLW